MPSHFVCAIIWRTNLITREIEFMVIDVRSMSPRTSLWSQVQTKFPGGMNRVGLVPEESTTMTLQREVLEEVGLAILPHKATEVWKFQASSDHTKYAFLISLADCRGELRTGDLLDNNDKMSEPYWVPVSVLGRILFDKHQSAFLAACRKLGVL